MAQGGRSRNCYELFQLYPNYLIARFPGATADGAQLLLVKLLKNKGCRVEEGGIE